MLYVICSSFADINSLLSTPGSRMYMIGDPFSIIDYICIACERCSVVYSIVYVVSCVARLDRKCSTVCVGCVSFDMIDAIFSRI